MEAKAVVLRATGARRLRVLRALSAAACVLVLSGPSFAAAGLVGAWGLNDVGGASEADYSGNNNRGTVNGALPTAAGKFGNALLFDGTSASVDLGNPTQLRLTGSVTISAWINSAAFPRDDAAIVSSFGEISAAGFQLDTTVDTGPRTVGFKLFDPNGNLMIRYGATALQLNQWVHVAGVYDAQAQTMNVYLNGVLDNGTQLGTVASSQRSSLLDVLIGQRADWTTVYGFNGTLDEVRIYDRALSQAEIQADMNAPIAPPAPDATAPSAPSGLKGLAPGASQINLAWTTSTDNFDVTAYRVERCQGAGCTDFAEIATASDLGFNDAGLAPGTSYSYRVRAADGAGNLSGYSGVVSVTTLAAPPSGGPVGAYPFEEGTGTTTADFSGSNNTGTLIGTTWTAGKIGNALAFDGVSANVDLGNPPALQFAGSMTVSAWINSAAFPRDDAAIVSSVQFGAPQGGFQFDTTIDTGPRTVGFKLFDPSGALMIRYGATVLQLNQWYHVAGVYDAQAQTMTVYLNGVADNGTLLGRMGNMQLPASLNMLIGQRADAARDYNFSGVIDEVRIYNRALTQAEIQADMGVSAGGPPPDTTPPTAPTGLSATAAGTTQINLAWTASTDNVGVTGYRVERCQGAGCTTFAQIATLTATSFSDTGLTAATSYSYRVRAADAAGNLSGYSSVASATTAGAAQVQAYYIHPDHLNTPRLIEDASGTTVWRWDQAEPFGSNPPNNNPTGVGAFEFNLKFPGQYFDRETNLAYNVMRDYDPGIGRYVESDPIGLGGGINTYAYVAGNPVSSTDPFGLWIVSVGGRGSFFFGGAGGTFGGSVGISGSGQVCFQIQSCGRLGVGESIGLGVTASAGTGQFCEGNSLGFGVFGNLGVGYFGGVSSNTTSNGTSVTATFGGGLGIAAGAQTCTTFTFCARP